MRLILIYRKLILLLALPALSAVAPALAVAQGAVPDSLSVARRVATIVTLAGKEYALGVSGRRVVAPEEVQEAREFLQAALIEVNGLPVAAREPADAALHRLLALIERTGPADSVAAVGAALVRVLAAVSGGALDPLPTKPPSLALGAAVFQAQCVECHGAGGAGDGPKARRLEGPPPADLSSPAAMATASPLDVYRKVTIGVAGTAMPEFEEQLSAEERWALALYVTSLRAGAGEVAEGEGLYATQCAACHGASGDGRGPAAATLSIRPPALNTFAVQGDRSDVELAALIRAGRPGSPMLAFARVLDSTQTARVIAFVRTLPSAERHAGSRTPPEVAAVFTSVRRQLDSSLALARAGVPGGAAAQAFDGYLAFEAVETELRARNPLLTRELEEGFRALRQGAGAGAPPDELEALHARLLAALERAERVVADRPSAMGLFVQSFVLLVREGFEAILLIAALMTFVTKAGAPTRRREIAWGAWLALGASVVTAVLIEAVFRVSPAEREGLEGFTMLVATAVLFYVSYWLLSKIEVAKWTAFVKARLDEALSAGSGLALAGVAFLAVYREGFETILFYKALLVSGGSAVAPVAGGFAVGAVALVGVYVAINQFGLKLPLKPFFAATSAMLYLMAFIFAGKGVAELQEAGWVGTTVIGSEPRLPALGLYPTLESLALQGVLVVLALAAVAWTMRGSLRQKAAASE